MMMTMMMMIEPDSYKVLATQAWGPWLNSQNPVKRQPGWCPLVIPCWEGRQKGPWDLMTSQPSLLGEQWDSEILFQKQWRQHLKNNTWPRLTSGFHRHTHAHTWIHMLTHIKSTHTFTHSFYLNLAFSLLVTICCATPTQVLPFSGLL